MFPVTIKHKNNVITDRVIISFNKIPSTIDFNTIQVVLLFIAYIIIFLFLPVNLPRIISAITLTIVYLLYFFDTELRPRQKIPSFLPIDSYTFKQININPESIIKKMPHVSGWIYMHPVTQKLIKSYLNKRNKTFFSKQFFQKVINNSDLKGFLKALSPNFSDFIPKQISIEDLNQILAESLTWAIKSDSSTIYPEHVIIALLRIIRSQKEFLNAYIAVNMYKNKKKHRLNSYIVTSPIKQAIQQILTNDHIKRVITLTGPKLSGKTTIAYLIGDKYYNKFFNCKPKYIMVCNNYNDFEKYIDIKSNKVIILTDDFIKNLTTDQYKSFHSKLNYLWTTKQNNYLIFLETRIKLQNVNNFNLHLTYLTNTDLYKLALLWQNINLIDQDISPKVLFQKIHNYSYRNLKPKADDFYKHLTG